MLFLREHNIEVGFNVFMADFNLMYIVCHLLSFPVIIPVMNITSVLYFLIGIALLEAPAKTVTGL